MGRQRSASQPQRAEDRVRAFVDHLRDVERWFNEASKKYELRVTVSAEAVIEALESGIGTKRASEYLNREDESGILHQEQIETAMAAIDRVLNDEHNGGLIKGAMQSGKTTASLAMQLVAPIYYLKKGKPLYPFFLLTVHTSQREQTVHELERFLGFYSHLTFMQKGGLHDDINDDFRHSRTLESYREFVLQAAAEDTFFSQVLKPEDYIATRAPGRKIARIAERMKKIADRGFVALMIIDEPQFGVMDHYSQDTDKFHPSVFKRIFRAIEEALNIPKGSHAFIGTSATPYEMHDVDGIWVVSQRLGPTYTGFNLFAGKKIDPDAECKTPVIHSLTEFAALTGARFLANFNLSAIDKPGAFYRHRKRLGLPDTMDYDQYRKAAIRSLRDALIWLAKNNPNQPFGVCVRARNNNNFARLLDHELKLGRVYETMQYNGEEAKDRSVKHLLATRQRPNDPYLLFVTNRARMGDAFPSSAKYFIELAEKFTDMNAMFQGFVGRACGYNKQTEIVLSDYNAQMLRIVVSVEGSYVFKPSRGSTIVGKRRRGRPSGMLRVTRGDDRKVDRFFSSLDSGFVTRRLKSKVGESLSVNRQRKGKPVDFKYAPIFAEAERLKLFEYLEDPKNRERFAEGYPDFHIVRENETLDNDGVVAQPLGYSLDGHGGCEVIVREFSKDLAQGGVRGRGSLGSSDRRREKQQECLMPQIIMRKYDQKTGVPIDDHDMTKRRVGVWKAYAITLPLDRPVVPVVAAAATLPIPGTVFYDNLSDEEKRKVQRSRPVKTRHGQAGGH
jgi:hypothetical protein